MAESYNLELQCIQADIDKVWVEWGEESIRVHCKITMAQPGKRVVYGTQTITEEIPYPDKFGETTEPKEYPTQY